MILRGAIGLRAIRNLYTVVVGLLGVFAVTAAIVSDPTRSVAARLSLAVVGLLLVHSASWRRSNPFLPNDRQAHDVRTEVEGLLASVRGLSRLGTPGTSADERAQIVESMRSAVDRIATLTRDSSHVGEREPDT